MASWSSLTFLISGKSSLRASLAVIGMTASLPVVVQETVPLCWPSLAHADLATRLGTEGLLSAAVDDMRGGWGAVDSGRAGA
jgi:hypothetical protein